MTQQGYVPNPMRLAFFAALLSSSAIAAAQEIPDMTAVPVPQEVPAPEQPTIPPVAPDEPIVAPAPSNPTDSIAPAARQALEAEETKRAAVAKRGEASRMVDPSPQRAAAPSEATIANEVSAPLPVAINAPADAIAADGTIASEPVVAEPVISETSVGDNDNSAENWLLALAGLGILGLAGGAGVAMTRRRNPVKAGAPNVIERMDRPVGNKSPIVTKPARTDVAEPNSPAREPFVARQPEPPVVVARTPSSPTSDIPIVDPMFAEKAELPPITDPLFANHPDFVGNKPTFKGFSLNKGASWSEPRRVDPAEKLGQPVN